MLRVTFPLSNYFVSPITKKYLFLHSQHLITFDFYPFDVRQVSGGQLGISLFWTFTF